MTELRLSQVVAASPSRTFEYLVAFEAYPEFMDSVERVRRDERHPERLHWIFSLASVMREYATDVAVDFEHRQLSWRGPEHSGPDHSGEATVEAHGEDQAEVRLRVWFYPLGVVGQLGDKLGLVRHRLAHDLRQFASYVESGGQRTPTRRRVAATSMPDDQPRTLSERLTDVLFGADNS